MITEKQERIKEYIKNYILQPLMILRVNLIKMKDLKNVIYVQGKINQLKEFPPKISRQNFFKVLLNDLKKLQFSPGQKGLKNLVGIIFTLAQNTDKIISLENKLDNKNILDENKIQNQIEIEKTKLDKIIKQHNLIINS